MKTIKLIVKTLAIALLAGAGLSGCIAVPAYGPGYGPAVYGPPVVVVPPIRFGFGGHGHHGHRGRW